MTRERSAARRVLFHRDFRAPAGGHLKLWHYFNHVAALPGYCAQIYFTPESIWDEHNPWYGIRSTTLNQWNPADADLLFVAGMDWLALPETQPLSSRQPIINLVQGMRHADPAHTLYQFLSRRAIRICVSQEVAAAIGKTGRANGPILCIPNGTDIDPDENPPSDRDIPLLIAGYKNPALAQQLAERLTRAGKSFLLLDNFVPRAQFLQLLARSEVALLLPLPAEGFYLPALEAMAMGALVICPDCIGNRSFCLDRYNAFFTPYDAQSLFDAVMRADKLDVATKTQLQRAAYDTARSHHLHHEATALKSILDDLDSLW